MRNPFICGSPISEPHYFYGRHQEIRRVIERLTNPGFESSSIVGGRRIGKTSLLQVLQRPQMRERFGLSGEFVFIDIDLSQRSDITQDKFWRLVLSEMQSTFVDENLSNQIDEILKKESVSLHDVDTIFETVVDQGFKVVLLLDEFENVVQSPKLGGDFYLGLRSLITAHKLAVVTASRRELVYYSLTEEIAASPFFNVFTNIYLLPFSIQEAHELIEGYLEGTGVSLSKDDVECVTRISGCHPNFLQLACSYLFDAYRGKKRISKIDRKEARQAVEEVFRVQIEPHFAYYWKHSTKGEQRVLATLAQRSQSRGLRAWMANRRYRRLSGQRTLTSLVNRGIVVKSDGDHQIFSPIFARWVLSRTSGVPGGEKVKVPRGRKAKRLSYLGAALSFAFSSLSMGLGLLFDLDFLFWPSVVLFAVFLLFALFVVLMPKEGRREI
ncbi:MAG: hypothetical protein E3J21_21075 [Anaerolineales bacterium]|nr:MAG: hypothetical protein E3J21_21075 [Anaerolineales bacterium]